MEIPAVVVENQIDTNNVVERTPAIRYVINNIRRANHGI
jgi:hypothetical protein